MVKSISGEECFMNKDVFIPEGEKFVKTIFDGYDNEEHIELLSVFIPKSVEGISAYALYFGDHVENFFIKYAGTMDEWRAIKKGAKKIVYEHDHYGEYYHNTYTDPEVRIHFNDWVGYSKSPVIIHCSDGDVENKEKENLENPFETTQTDSY